MDAQLIEQKHWKRPDQLVVTRQQGFGYKYFRKEDVPRRIDEGWEVCSKNEKVLRETGAVDTTQNYRQLILMRMPLHMVEERNKYYRDKHDRRIRQTARGSALATITARAATKSNTDSNKLAGALGEGLVARTETITHEGLKHTSEIRVPIGGGEEEEVILTDPETIKKAKRRK